jgi:hypothetical protein
MKFPVHTKYKQLAMVIYLLCYQLDSINRISKYDAKEDIQPEDKKKLIKWGLKEYCVMTNSVIHIAHLVFVKAFKRLE